MVFGKRKQGKEPAYNGGRRVLNPPVRGTVFSYHANRSARPDTSNRSVTQYNQEDVPKRSSKVSAKKRAGTLLIALLLIGFAVFNLRLDNQPKIVILGGQSNKIFLQSTGLYEQSIKSSFSSSILNNNKVTVDTSRIAEQIHSQFPELAAVSIALPFIGSQPTVYILPATPQLILQDTSGQRFVLDLSGTALINADNLTNNQLDIPNVVDQSGIRIKAGKLALPNSSVAFISEVAGELRAEGVTATSYTLPAGTSEMDVKVAGESYYVRFDLHGDAREETGTYLAVKQQLDSNHTTPAKYVDVMVTGRAYYL
jgi:hypothetical protein